jgi:hypothetical protein
MLQDEPRRMLGRRRVALRKASGEGGEIELSIGPDVDAQVEPVNGNLGKGPCPPQHARQLEVDEQALEAQERRALTFGQDEVTDLYLEQQRIDPHAPDARLALQVLGNVARDAALDEPRRNPESQRGVEQQSPGRARE